MANRKRPNPIGAFFIYGLSGILFFLFQTKPFRFVITMNKTTTYTWAFFFYYFRSLPGVCI
jgi:hypothetical protein